MESLPTRGAWIEIESLEYQKRPSPSLPTRGAWIEMIAISMVSTI